MTFAIGGSTEVPEQLPVEQHGLNVGAEASGLQVGSGIPPDQDSNPDPIDNADTFTLTKDVNQTQLTDELSAALKHTVLITVTGYDNNRPISDSNPGKLWVSPSGLDEDTIATVIQNHSPFQAYDTPKADQEYSALVEKILANNDTPLDDEDMRKLVVGLVLRTGLNSTTTVSPSFESGV